MTHNQADAPVTSASSFVELLQKVVRLTPNFHQKTGVLIFIGAVAALAETLGITVLITFVFMLMGGGSSALGNLPMGLSRLLPPDVSASGIAWLLFGAIGFRLGASTLNSVLISRTSNQISQRVRKSVYDRLLSMPFAEYTRRDRGDLITVLATETYSISSAHYCVVRMGVNIVTVITFVVVLTFTAWQIALLCVFGGALYLLIMQLLSKKARKIGSESSKTLELMTKLSWTTLKAMRTVRSFHRESMYQREFEGHSQEVTRLLTRSERMGYTVTILSELLTLSILIAIMVTASSLHLGLHAVLASTALIYRLQPHVREFDRCRLSLLELDAAINRTEALMMPRNGVSGPEKRHAFSGLKEGLALKRVTYQHIGSDAPCLTEVDLFIPAGKITALTGESGTGKTTLLNLIIGLLQPQSGEILIDGVELDQLDKDQWLSHVALAGQDVDLIEGTVRENIVMKREGITTAQVRAASEIAGIASFIESLPLGFDEWIGDEGYNVSGGQRQRIGLARAVVGNPTILILDEALNALDKATESEVWARIEAHFKDKTLIVVTHELNTCERYDHIIKLAAPTH